MAVGNDYPYPESADPGAPQQTSGDPWTPEELAQSQQWANQYYSSHQIPASFGTPDDIANSYVQFRRSGMDHASAMAKLATVPAQLGWDKQPAAPTPDDPGAPAPTPPPAVANVPAPAAPPPIAPPTIWTAKEDPGYQLIPAPAPPTAFPGTPQGGVDRTNAIVDTIPQSFYQAPEAFDYPQFVQPTFNAPTFDAPGGFHYDPYTQLTGEQVLAQDPGFAFREQEGSRAITNNASAAGLLKSTGTAKALADYNSSLASEEYGNAEHRHEGVYSMNRANAASDYDTLWKNKLTEYGVKYGAAQDVYARAAAAYDTNFRTAATRQGFSLDAAAGAAGGKHSAASLAGNLALGAGQLGLGLGSLNLNASNDTFNNLLSLYRTSTANLPTYTPPSATTFA